MFLKKVINNINEYGIIPERTIYYLIRVFSLSKKEFQIKYCEEVINYVLDCNDVGDDFKKFLLGEIKNSMSNGKSAEIQQNDSKWNIFMENIFSAHSPEERKEMLKILNIDSIKNRDE